MKGKILHVERDQGIIAAKTGERYFFNRSEWKTAVTEPKPGLLVDYQLNEGRAVGVYLDQDASQINRAGFYRTATGKMLGGVCAGLSHKWRISLSGLRFVTAAGTLLLGLPLLLYFVAWLVFPVRSVEVADVVP